MKRKIEASDIEKLVMALNKHKEGIAWKDTIPTLLMWIKDNQPKDTAYTLEFWLKEYNIIK